MNHQKRTITVRVIKIFIYIGAITLLFLVMENLSDSNHIQEIDESSIWYPYEDVKYADKKTMKALMKIYENIDFSSVFQKGNMEEYDLYKEKYSLLLDNEMTFTLPETGELYYLKDYRYISGSHEVYDAGDYMFQFFDMDGDGAPELIMTDHVNFICCFRYNKNTGMMTLWYQTGFLWESVHGTRTLRWDLEGRQHLFYRLDENGKEIFRIMFFERDNNGEIIYMAALPSYENGETVLNRSMKKDAYYSENSQMYYFRVTEDQYDTLTRGYWEAVEESDKDREEVTFTYDELFE